VIARVPLIAGALAAAALAAGCGDDEGRQIPRDEARALISRLQEADRRLSQDPPVCGDLAEDTIPALEQQAAALPDDVDSDVRQTLEDGIAHLRDQIEAECAERREQEEDTTETTDTTDETTTETTETAPPTTETTETAPPTDTDTTPTDTTPTEPGSGGIEPQGQQKKQKKKAKDGD
jgi:hypothetical protein